MHNHKYGILLMLAGSGEPLKMCWGFGGKVSTNGVAGEVAIRGAISYHVSCHVLNANAMECEKHWLNITE